MASTNERTLVEECASLREWGERMFFACRSLLLAVESGDEKAVEGAKAHARQAMGSTDSGSYGPEGYVPRRQAG